MLVPTSTSNSWHTFKWPPFQGPGTITRIFLPSGDTYTRVESWGQRPDQTEPQHMILTELGDTPNIRRLIERLLKTEGYKLLDLRKQPQPLSESVEV